jgi:TolB protein
LGHDLLVTAGLLIVIALPACTATIKLQPGLWQAGKENQPQIQAENDDTTSMLAPVGDAPEFHEPAPSITGGPKPILASSRDGSITMFGELPDRHPEPYVASSGPVLTQHSHAPEGGDFDPDLTPDGSLMVFASTRHSPTANLYIKTPDGVAVTQLTSDPWSDVQPAVSPDGSWIAFASNRGGHWDIWMMEIGGGPPVQISDRKAEDVHPTWSQDGTKIAFSSLPAGGGQWELWVVEPTAGSAPKMIGHGLFPEWSPADDVIVYQRARRRGTRWFSIWTMEFMDGEPSYPREIASSGKDSLILPSWSADGTQVAFCAVAPGPIKAGNTTSGMVPSGRSDIWIVGTDGNDRIRLTDGRSANFAPTWSPDGRVFFTSRRDGGEHIWSALPPGGGMPTMIKQEPPNRKAREAGLNQELESPREPVESLDSEM